MRSASTVIRVAVNTLLATVSLTLTFCPIAKVANVMGTVPVSVLSR